MTELLKTKKLSNVLGESSCIPNDNDGHLWARYLTESSFLV